MARMLKGFSAGQSTDLRYRDLLGASMKTALATPVQQASDRQLTFDGQPIDNELDLMRNPRPEPASVYDLEVLISRIADGETCGRAANLPLSECRAGTVREALQMVIDQARGLINECHARDKSVPWIDPPSPPEDNESRFVVPLVM